MKSSIRYLIVLSLLILIICGCKKGSSSTPDPIPVPDTTNPTISIIKPTPGQIFVAGNTIPVQATFSDNEKFKSYEINVSKKITGGLTFKVVPTSTPFSYTKSSASLPGGKTQDISLSDINIPANTATDIVTPGIYNFKVTCVDASNNSAEPL
jgi:hypothetical protein